MSQKASRRNRNQTDDDTSSTKSTTPKPNGTNGTPDVEIEEIESEKTETIATISTTAIITTTEEETKTIEEIVDENKSENEITESQIAVEVLTNGHNNETKESDEMEPLTDEPDPELVFEEASEPDNIGRESPILSRCKTRRSLTRNVLTPKPVKNEEETELEEELNATFESCVDTASINAQVGGDSTRLDFTETNLMDSNAFLQSTKDKTFVQSLRQLSMRRSIRPVNNDAHHRRVTSVVDGFVVGKRKHSEDEEECKRFKSDSPGFFQRLSSPLMSIRHTFKGEIASSTPKLTGYKDENCEIEENGQGGKTFDVKEGEKRWCLIM